MLPTKETWELDDATVKSALRFQLGVSPGPPSHTFYRCTCDYQVLTRGIGQRFVEGMDVPVLE